MDKKDYRLKGHESFTLREGWLTKGLNAVHENPRVFSENSGADALGVGTNMAKSIRYWMRTAELTKEHPRDGVTLTEYGNLIFQNDPYFEDIFSLWVIHANIARNFKLATSWNIFFNNIDVTSFKREELINMMTENIINITGDTMPPERSIADDCAAILQMYTENGDVPSDPEEKRISPFAALGFLSKVDSNTFEKKHPARDLIDPSLILYVIADKIREENVLSIDDIVSGNNMPGKVFYLNRVSINEYLDQLQNKGYIRVNRTAGLDVIYPAYMPTTYAILEEHYERSHKKMDRKANIAALRRNYNIWVKLCRDHEQKRNEHIAHLEYAKENRDSKNQQLDVLSRQNEANESVNRAIAYAEAVYAMADRQLKKKQSGVFEQLNEIIAENFDKMFNDGEKYAKLEDDYRIHVYYHSVGGSMDYEEQNLSNGEATAINFVYIVSVLELARRKAAEEADEGEMDSGIINLPLVLDGPFSTLSNENTSLVAKKLPEFAEQVIIFMLDKDWASSGLEEFVLPEYCYRVKKEEKANSSTIERGGFE